VALLFLGRFPGRLAAMAGGGVSPAVAAGGSGSLEKTSAAAGAPARVPVPVARQDPVARLSNPNVVQQRARTTPLDNDSLVKAIEGRLRCTCGCNLDVYTCRTTDFTCATSPAMHRAVLARLDSALAAGFAQAAAASAVIERFEAQYGQTVLMAPPRRGFNWAAYVTPFLALLAGFILLAWLMRRWIRARPSGATLPLPPGADEPPPGVTAAEFERLRRELEHFEA
jgi:cytochrome c-type biogenesis protein CcmH